MHKNTTGQGWVVVEGAAVVIMIRALLRFMAGIEIPTKNDWAGMFQMFKESSVQFPGTCIDTGDHNGGGQVELDSCEVIWWQLR